MDATAKAAGREKSSFGSGGGGKGGGVGNQLTDSIRYTFWKTDLNNVFAHTLINVFTLSMPSFKSIRQHVRRKGEGITTKEGRRRKLISNHFKLVFEGFAYQVKGLR